MQKYTKKTLINQIINVYDCFKHSQKYIYNKKKDITKSNAFLNNLNLKIMPYKINQSTKINQNFINNKYFDCFFSKTKKTHTKKCVLHF